MASNSIDQLTPLNPQLGTITPEAERAKVEALAQQFESMLLAQMMREMKASMAPDSDDEQGFGGAIMADTFTAELSLALSRAGGVGLSKVLLDGFLKQLPSAERPGREDGPADLSAVAYSQAVAKMEALPATAEAPGAVSMSEGGRSSVTSEFGWRTDPINGRHRFHAGTDLRMAYGQDVRSAAAGSVTFAGEQGGYGNTVVVRHPDGVETRYAHLSSIHVRVGDDVSAGEVIARSGNTGRTTGPHLHFEVRQHGRPVAPEAVDGLASLEEIGGGDED